MNIETYERSLAGNAEAKKSVAAEISERAKRSGTNLDQARAMLEKELAATTTRVTLIDFSRAAIDAAASKKIHAEVLRRRASAPSFTWQELRAEVAASALAPRPAVTSSSYTATSSPPAPATPSRFERLCDLDVLASEIGSVQFKTQQCACGKVHRVRQAA